MKKDAYYFPHFSNARTDRKVRRVMKELGIEGYAIYFMTLEVLREQTEFRYPIMDIDLLADEFGTSESKVRVVICNYDLFLVDEDNMFFSPKLLLYLQPYLEKSNRAREAARIRWDKSKSNANALQMQSKSNASKVKESKVKKSKVNDFIKKSIDFLNNELGTNYTTKPEEVNKNLLKIEKAKYTLEDIKKVVLSKNKEWKNDTEKKYLLRPSTLFRFSNFEKYLDESKNINPIKQKFKDPIKRVNI